MMPAPLSRPWTKPSKDRDTVMAAMATTIREMPEVIEVLGRGRHIGLRVMCQP